MNLILSESFPLPCLFLVTLASTLGILSSPCSTWQLYHDHVHSQLQSEKQPFFDPVGYSHSQSFTMKIKKIEDSGQM